MSDDDLKRRTKLAAAIPAPPRLRPSAPAIGTDPPQRTVVSGAPTSMQPAARAAVARPTPEAVAVAATSDVDLSPGARLKQFELIRELGRGGMGQVFLARDTRLARLVALKFLGHASEELTQRFLVEARATARCHHENIVLVYEADEWQGKPYMALEFLEGEPLSKVLSGRPLPPSRAVEIIVQVVRALVRAHEHSIVHCDLKPDNILITKEGVVKVLDFGIARALAGSADLAGTTEDGISGTMPYMSPEQWGADEVDHRTDLWAIGIVLWEMLTARHPLEPLSQQRLMYAAAMLDQPMPPIASAMPDCPPELERIIERCLAKRKAERYANARELLDALEPLLPGRYGRRLDEDENPYPGMIAFQEGDADRFFGRDRDVTHMVTLLADSPLLGVIAPSGVGKSSFVRAGVIPALRASDTWEVLVTRPGRSPLASLATLLQPIAYTTGRPDLQKSIDEHEQLVARLRSEPGYLGSLLRSRARQKRERILLFVDQFEELYTLGAELDERRAFTACLAGAADDAATPLRVVLSMRSDFLHRAAEDRAFMDRLTKGILFLPPIDREGMRSALEEPIAMAGYSFESAAIVGDMLDTLEGTAGALPLLQFTAARLWETRARDRRTLTMASYQAMGGVAGALASHADQVIGAMTPERQRLARAVLLRLVTAEGTREIVDLAELATLADQAEITALVDQLVTARLLAVQTRDEGPAVEIVHESLITQWPMLKRWLEESSEDSVFLGQLRAAAKQWDSRGRVAGLLWRGEAMEDARTFARRYKGELPARERAFLDAVLAEASRASRRRRRLVVSAFIFLGVLIAAGAVALLWIRDAQQEAETQQVKAEREADRARNAEAQSAKQLETIKEQLRTIQQTQAAKDTAEAQKAEAEKSLGAAQSDVEQSREQLQATNHELKAALARATSDRARAEEATKQAKAANDQLTDALNREREQVKQLEEKMRGYVKKL